MVKSKAAEVVYDPSYSYSHRSRSGASGSGRSYFHSSHSRASRSELCNFMSSKLADMYQKPIFRASSNQSDSENEEIDIRKILKDIEHLGSSNMTWKERKKTENQNIVALGGKAPKSNGIPLSVAKVAMKKQKQREQKKMEEAKILGRFVRGGGSNDRSKAKKPKPEDRVLKASEGHFKKGVLDVKHLFAPTPSKRDDGSSKKIGKRKKKVKGRERGRERDNRWSCPFCVWTA